METWIDFARGPLFRLSFSLMLLGLLRIFVLTTFGMVEAYRKNPDRIIPWKDLLIQTAHWLFPVKRLWRKRPIYGTLSFLFHIGLILVPLFLPAHVLLWRRSIGFAWPPIPQPVSDWLTLIVMITGPALFLGRLLRPEARSISRPQDYLWPLLLTLPFTTGYVCSNALVSPKTYQVMMLIHVFSGDLILGLLPFTKIVHCVLSPLSQFVTAIAWKFPVGAGDRVAQTLGYGQQPSWHENSRLGRKIELPAIFEREEQAR